MKGAIPEEAQWLQDVLRSAIERSRTSHSQIEQALGLEGGALDAIFSGTAELEVAHLFGILHLLDLDVWELLILELRPELRADGR